MEEQRIVTSPMPVQSRPPTPTPYSEKVALAICDRLSNGETLSKICEDADQPNTVTVHGWVARKPEFAKAYHEARERQAHALLDEVIDMSRDICSGSPSPQKVGAVRNLVDLMKWTVGRLNPKAYGDRVGLVPSIAIQINTSLGLASDDAAVQGGTYKLKAQPAAEEVGALEPDAPAPPAPQRKRPGRKKGGIKSWKKKPRETGNAT